MKKIFLALSVLVSLYGCNAQPAETVAEKKEFNEALAQELATMVEVDQLAANVPPPEFRSNPDAWEAYKDSVFNTHKIRLEEVFSEYGYPGFDLVGEGGEHDFWLMVQHCDSDPDFQAAVLKAMANEIEKGNADKTNYAYLTDRVRKNTGQKILYGTQVTYNSLGQAISRPLEDSLNVNVRRAEVGLEPLEVYLNRMTEMHFEMNKENMLKRGITEPKLHAVKTSEPDNSL